MNEWRGSSETPAERKARKARDAEKARNRNMRKQAKRGLRRIYKAARVRWWRRIR